MSNWVKTTGGHFVPKSATSQPIGCYFNTTAVNAIPSTLGSEGVWNTVDLADGSHWTTYGTNPGIPNVSGVKAVRLQGVMIITHAGDPGLADFHIAFRASRGDPFYSGNYQMQCEVSESPGGTRSPASYLIPVRDGKFQLHWKRLHPSDPTTFDAGFNFKFAEIHY